MKNEKKLKVAKALYQRVSEALKNNRLDKDGNARLDDGKIDMEYAQAKRMLEAILKNLGITEEDLAESLPENETTVERVHFTPDIDSKKNPPYFRLLVNLLSQVLDIQVITLNNRLGCIFIGAKEKIAETVRYTEHALERGKIDYRPFAEWKPIFKKNEKDFKLGFSVGYHTALLEKIAKDQATSESSDADTQALILISKMLAEKQAINDTVQDMKDNNGVQQNTEDFKPKNKEVYKMGVLCGLKAFVLLLTKGE